MSSGPGGWLPGICPTPRAMCWPPDPTNGSTLSRGRRCPARATPAIFSSANRARVRTALVTGGSGGIGKACAGKLCEMGYDVVLSARRVDPLRAAADEIGARYIVADVSDAGGVVHTIRLLATIELVV